MGTSTRVILAVLDLLLFLYPCACTQNCSSRIVPPELDGPQIWPVNKPQNGFMSSIVDSFLSSVQPNPFPKELLIKTLNSGGINDKATINEVLRYEAGFLVCVAIGILYIILMPLIGMCFACCRCCGNCGGYMYQKQTNNINCRRQSIYWVTFLITILIFNTYTHKSMNSAPGEFNNTLKNLQSYVTTIPKQIDQVVNESCLVVDNVTYNIQVIQNTSLLLYTLNSTQKELDLLKTNLTGVKTRLNKTIHNQDCVQCDSLASELDKLSLNTSINYTGQVQQVLQNSNITIPSIVLLDAETKKQLSNFSSTASSVNFSSIMQKVTTLLGTNLSHPAKLDALVNIQVELKSQLEHISDTMSQINNAFWFSLGWCLVFLIPSIIFSVKLAKFYRRMKHNDEFLDNFVMNPIPQVNPKSL
ncbi:prominin-2 precursor [Silurus asotus]|uniref:Prominin-2 n=1 Tax=Silurus asotus TaxID=30991 RepID=A0AAD5AHX9_SILAS|nr:prominin-2 precursor [Silurus asotus]